MEKKKEEWEIASFANNSNNIYLKKLEAYEYQKMKQDEKKQCYKIASIFIALIGVAILFCGIIEGWR